MNQIADIVRSALICPYTGQELVELTKKEITLINAKISNGLYFFSHGAQVNVKLKKGFICSGRSYIYPVFDDIIYLKKITAIVPKNRTVEPTKRISKECAEEFYKEYGLGRKFNTEPVKNLNTQNNLLTLEQIADLGKLLPKSGKSFVSIVTHDLDSMHNLAYGRDFDQFLHIDFSIDRLKSVVNNLKDGTLYILADINNLPLKDNSVSALFSFDYINNYEKKMQKMAYVELRRSLAENGSSVVLYERHKPLYAKGKLISDKMSSKVLKLVAPWKKSKGLDMYFYPVGENRSKDHQSFVTKTSLGKQFS